MNIFSFINSSSVAMGTFMPVPLTIILLMVSSSKIFENSISPLVSARATLSRETFAFLLNATFSFRYSKVFGFASIENIFPLSVINELASNVTIPMFAPTSTTSSVCFNAG